VLDQSPAPGDRVTSPSSHREHLARHLDRVSRSFGAAQAQAVLERATVHLEGSQVKTSQGGEVGPTDCTQYLDAVRAVIGNTEYFPARVNFILAGCSGVHGPEAAERSSK